MTGRASIKRISDNYLGSRGAAFMLKNRAGVEAIITQTGGRLFSLKLAGQEVLFNNPDMLRQLPDLVAKYRAAGCKREGVLDWPHLNGAGGEKTLFAPQMDGVPHPVPNIGMFDATEYSGRWNRLKGVGLVSEVCPETGLQVLREIVINESNDSFIVSARLKYHGTAQGADSPLVKVAPWSVMQLLMPANINLANLTGKPEAFSVPGVFMPQEEVDRSGLIQQLGTDSFRISLQPNLPQMAKVGYNYKPNSGNEQVTINFPAKELALFLTNLSQGGWANPHGYRAETFWCGDYFEQEVLSPVQELRRGETTNPLTYLIRLNGIQTA